MPTYDYNCETCGPFEATHSITAAPLTSCPKCGAAVKRMISRNVAIIFKGEGFYTTDNRSASYSEGQKSEVNSTSETKSDPKSETKSETKSDSKHDTKPAVKSESKAEKAS